MAELLAPAGSFDALRAAVEAGADAIYLAGKMFGARAYAANFDDEELAQAVRYAHLHKVRVYVAVNTLLDEREFTAALEYISYLNEICVDALIVQDLGLAALVKAEFPAMHLHASTQMTVHNKSGAEYLAGLGFTRVVLSREMALNEIEEICRMKEIEVEVFVHGALCISYSGQCLMSSMIGGRSGNRGRCAQPCRLPYQLQNQQGDNALKDSAAGTYLLSPKDLNSLRLLPELTAAGVASFKIEGRMKKPEYVAVVVDAYRKVMKAPEIVADENEYKKLERNLAQIFNRDFTADYLKGIKPGADAMSHQRPNNRGRRIGRISAYDHQLRKVRIKLEERVCKGDILDIWVSVGGRVNLTLDEFTVKGCNVDAAEAQEEIELRVSQPVRLNDRVFKVFDQELMQYARGFFEEEKVLKKIVLAAVVSIELGAPASLELRDEDGNVGFAQTDFITEKALKRALTQEVVKQQLNRLGNTSFAIGELEINLADGVMVPVSELNELRRKAIKNFEAARLRKFASPVERMPENTVVASRIRREAKRAKIAVQVSELDDVYAAVDEGADRIIFGGENFSHRTLTKEEYHDAVMYCSKHERQIIIATPRIITAKNWSDFLKEVKWAEEFKADGLMVANLGSLNELKGRKELPVFADYPLNVYNVRSGNFLAAEGCVGICLSPELNFTQISTISRSLALELECIVHGRLELMTTEYCVRGAFKGCEGCNDDRLYLEDRKQEHFPVVRDQYCRMHVLNAKTLDMSDHAAKFCELGIDWLRIDGRYKEMSLRGLVKKYVRALQQAKGEVAENCGDNTITRGHYFRGVL